MGFRCCPVDLVGQHNVGEDGAGHEFEGLLLAIENRDADDVRRKQIAGELDAFEGTVERSGKAMGERGLAHPGDIFEQEMPPRQQGHHGHLDDMRLAFDDSRNILLNRSNRLR